MSTEQQHIDALTKVGLAMASTADYEAALVTLITTISEILDVETAGFMLYEPDSDRLVLQEPAFGIFDPAIVRAYRVTLSDGGNAVEVFRSRQPYMTNDARSDPRLLQQFVAMFDARNIATVPLTVEDEVIGVCHGINKRGNRGFSSTDLELFVRIAPLLAVSVQSAGMFRDLLFQRLQLERAVLLQRELSQAAFDAPGMTPLAARLAELVDHPIMILDPSSQPLAAARWPDEMAPSESWVTSDAASPEKMLVTPIAVGRHLGGYLAVLHDSEPLDELNARAIEHAAGVFALEMLREQTSFEVEARLKGDRLQDLLSGDVRDREAAELLGELESSTSGPWRVAIAAATWRPLVQDPQSPWQDEVQVPDSRLYRALQQICQELFGRAAVVPWRSRFLVLLPAESGDRAADHKLAVELHARARTAAEEIRPGSQLHTAVSAVVRSIRELGRGASEAQRAFRMARTLAVTERPLLFDHLGVYRVVLSGGDARDRSDFVSQSLGSLKEHDEERGTALLATLRAYVASDFNAAEAARRLYVHPNTLMHRLAVMRRILGGDPSKGDLRLQVELALRLDDLAGAGPADADA